MPDFNFKNGSVGKTTTVPAAAAAVKPVAAPKVSEPAAAATKSDSSVDGGGGSVKKPDEKREKDDKGKENSAPPLNFSRNSGKYATLPVKKSSDVIGAELEVDHFSDGEYDDGTASVDSVCLLENSSNGVVQSENKKSPNTITEESEDVSRPIDKNDVD